MRNLNWKQAKKWAKENKYTRGIKIIYGQDRYFHVITPKNKDYNKRYAYSPRVFVRFSTLKEMLELQRYGIIPG